MITGLIFACPRCGAELCYRIGNYRECSDRGCFCKWDSRKMNRHCNHPGCNKKSVALCLNSSGQWESRCEEHITGRAVRIKKKHTVYRKTREVIVRGEKRRIIRKGEFPGQHPI